MDHDHPELSVSRHACSWGSRDQRSTTGQCRCANRCCGSWPGLTRCTWTTLAVAAGGWLLTWPEKGSRSAVTVSETSCGAWAYGRTTRNPGPRFQAIHPSGFLAWSISEDYVCGSRLGHRHHLHPAEERLSLPGGDYGSPPQACAQLEAIQQP